MDITRILTVWFLFMLGGLASADSILLASGDNLKGSILRREGDNVVIEVDYGIVRYDSQAIKSVNGKPLAGATTVSAPSSTAASQSNGLPRWRNIAVALSSQPWATGFQQIPATVIDKGVMRNVPYLSFKCGGDYEMNIYGDPDNPAGVEIGIYRGLLKDETAKKNCVEFVASLLGTKLMRDVVRVMDRRKSLFEYGGMSLEITPETDEDAYGGWWASAYREKALDAARATDVEVAKISVAKATTPAADPLAWSSSDMKLARSQALTSTSASPSTSSSTAIASSGNSSFGGDRVYVRGYFRKNGTYVHSYTRSR